MNGAEVLIRADRLAASRRYLAATAVGDFAWEVAQLPLYSLWNSGAPGELAFDVAHCLGGDILIAAAALVLALIIAGARNWPARRFAPVALVAVVAGLAYTGFSEWLNVAVRKSWSYSSLMPTIEIHGFALGLSPMLQWLVVPLCAFTLCRRARTKA